MKKTLHGKRFIRANKVASKNKYTSKTPKQKSSTFDSLPFSQQISQMTRNLVTCSIFFIRGGLANSWQIIEMPDNKKYIALLLPEDKWEIVGDAQLGSILHLKSLGKLEIKNEETKD